MGNPNISAMLQLEYVLKGVKATPARARHCLPINRQCHLKGSNNWAFEIASKRKVRPLQNGMDGTTVVRILDFHLDEYLVGEQFLPDVCL